MTKTATILQNLFELEKILVHITDGLHMPNVVVYTNTNGRILGRGKIDDQLDVPKGTHKVVFGPLKF
jgi:hypothetical protein